MIGQSQASVMQQAETQARVCEPDRLLPRSAERHGDAAPVYLDHDGAVFKRRLSGLTTTVVVPFQSFTGVAVRFEPESGIVRIELIHPDPSMSVPLDTAFDLDRAARLWRRWSLALALPMMMFEADGSLVLAPVDERTDSVHPPIQRRFGRQTTRRRPRMAWRRGRFSAATAAVHGGEREIIARN